MTATHDDVPMTEQTPGQDQPQDRGRTRARPTRRHREQPAPAAGSAAPAAEPAQGSSGWQPPSPAAQRRGGCGGEPGRLRAARLWPGWLQPARHAELGRLPRSRRALPPSGYAQAGTGRPGYGQPGYGQPGYGQYPQAGYDPSAGGWQHDTTALPLAEAEALNAPGAPGKPATKRTKPRGGLMLATAAMVGLLAGGVGGYVGTQLAEDSTSSTGSVTLPQAGGTSAERPAGSIAAIAQSVSPAVVSISVTGDQGSGTGSGFVLREDGYILTNNHVVESAASGGSISVRFSDGRTLDARSWVATRTTTWP